VKKRSQSRSDLDLRQDFAAADPLAWQEAAERLLKGAAIDTLVTETYEGIRRQPIYHRQDTTTGVCAFPTNSDGTWQICQDLPFTEPAEFNRAARDALSRGQDVLLLRLPTQQTSGSQLGSGITTLRNLETCLDKIDLTKTPLLVQAGAQALPALALFTAYCQKRGMNQPALQGAILLDPLAELAATGRWCASPETTFRDLSALAVWSHKNLPALRTLGVDASLYHNAGATAVQELAFAVATGTEYLRQAARFEPALTVDDVAGLMLFSFASGPDFFMQIAKLRAARLLWDRIVSVCGGSGKKMKLHACTATWNKSTLDPHVNILRATTEALAAVLAGCDSLQVGPFEAPTGSISPLAQRLARNTQIILKEEVHLDRVIDPSAGSWYLDALTEELARVAWQLFQQIEQEGGMFQALRAGLPQNLVRESVQERVRRVNNGTDTLIGTNKNIRWDEDLTGLLASARSQTNGGTARQSNLPVDQGLPFNERIKALAGAFLNGQPFAAVACTLDETGTEVQIEALQPWRASQRFENLRKATTAYETKRGKPLSAILLCLGVARDYKVPAARAADFLRVAGIRTVQQEVRPSSAFPDAPIFVMCGKNNDSPETVLTLATALKKQQPSAVLLLAGQPGERAESLRKAGIDHFIFEGINVPDVLTDVLIRIGALDDPVA